jgi:hypothetical protein
VGVPNQADEWKQATAQFLASPEGQNWDGSRNSLELMGWLLQTNGLQDAEDKVAALKACAAEMHNRGLDVSPEKKVEIRADSSPAEIIKNWKSAYGNDPAKIGEAFRKWFA